MTNTDLGRAASPNRLSQQAAEPVARLGPPGFDPARIEYHTLDKSEWLPGPWQSEPDKVQYRDETTGFPCLIVRGPSGALCGYVGVSPGHPWHGVDYNGVMVGDDEYVDVHWGLTYADKCQHSTDPSQHICHIPAPGEPDDVWWLGFDCAHSGDLTELKRSYGYACITDTYRDIGFVEGECRKLARQAGQVAASGIEAATAVETVQQGSTEGESPTANEESGDAQKDQQ